MSVGGGSATGESVMSVHELMVRVLLLQRVIVVEQSLSGWPKSPMMENPTSALLRLFVGRGWMSCCAVLADELGRVEGKALALLRCDARAKDQT